jgi:hypothetical protein
VILNLPVAWESRRMIQNILQIAWMDVFEQAGWTILSNWNSANSAAECSVHPSATDGVVCSASEDSAAEPPLSAASVVAPDGSGGVAGADLIDFKGECTNFLLFKRAGPGMHASYYFVISASEVPPKFTCRSPLALLSCPAPTFVFYLNTSSSRLPFTTPFHPHGKNMAFHHFLHHRRCRASHCPHPTQHPRKASLTLPVAPPLCRPQCSSRSAL